jgi:hypothetical protein
VTRSIYKHGLGYERCDDKGEISIKFMPSSTYNDEEETLKAKQIPYPPNPKPSFNPKRGVKRESLKSREETFICMFCGRAGHFDEFYFRRKRIERKHVEYARNSYRDEFIDFLPRSYSHVSPCFYSRAPPCTSSHAFPQFPHGPNHRSYGFGPRENRFEPKCFGYGPRPHRSDRFLRRSGFPAGGSFIHFKPRHLDDPCFPHHGSHPTRSNGEMERMVKTSFGHMVNCCIPKIYLTNPSMEPSTPSHPM